MGIWDVDALAENMSMHLLTRWMIFINWFQPFPHKADELYNAMNSTLIVQAAGARKSLKDFRIDWLSKHLREPMTEEQMKRVLGE